MNRRNLFALALAPAVQGSPVEPDQRLAVALDRVAQSLRARYVLTATMSDGSPPRTARVHFAPEIPGVAQDLRAKYPYVWEVILLDLWTGKTVVL